MILPLFLAQASPAADVVVTADRLHRLRLATTMKDGRLTDCVVRVSSGDAWIDRTACEATRGCIAQGMTSSEPLANCVDARITADVRRRADANPTDK